MTLGIHLGASMTEIRRHSVDENLSWDNLEMTMTNSSASRLVGGVLLISPDQVISEQVSRIGPLLRYGRQSITLHVLNSCQEARCVLSSTPSIALCLIRTDPENYPTVIDLVDFIRNERNDTRMRIVLVSDDLLPIPVPVDIDDFRHTFDLSPDRLPLLVRSELAIYEQLKTLQEARDNWRHEAQAIGAELAAKQEELLKLKKAFETTEVGITITDNDGRIVYSNPADAAMHGYTVEEVIGRPSNIFASKIIHQPRNRKSPDFKNFVNWKRETTNIRQDGSEFPVTLISNVIKDTDGHNIGMVVICEDISERKQAEEELRRLSRAVEQSSTMILITDAEGTIEFVNPAFCAHTGFRPDEVLGQNLRLLKSNEHEPAFYEQLWQTITSNQTWHGEVINRKKNGDLYWEMCTITPIKDPSGDTSHFIAVKNDITKRKEMELALKESEQNLRELNATKDKFFSIIGHDLKNPLTVLMGYSEMMLQLTGSISPEDLLAMLTELNKSSNLLYKLIENLLEWSRVQTGRIAFEPEPVDLHALVDHVFSLLEPSAMAKKITLSTNSQVNNWVYADQNMINTVLRNLVSNAIKFTRENGDVSVHIEALEDFMEVAVIDNGVGIPESELPKLFRIDMNYTTVGTANEEGTGLGLILCQEFVAKHHGTITVQSVENQGSTFRITLPKTKAVFDER